MEYKKKMKSEKHENSPVSAHMQKTGLNPSSGFPVFSNQKKRPVSEKAERRVE